VQRSFVPSIALAAAVLASPVSASADILSGYAQVQAGAAGGVGLTGDQKDDAFHAGAAGLSYGALIGVEIVFVDVWIEHNQFLSSGELEGTWTQFMTGLDIEFDLGGKEGGVPRVDGTLEGGHSKLYGEFGFGVGYGVGTGQQVEPPLDNSQLTDKGFVVQATVGGGFRLTPMFTLGLSAPMQAGYMFKSGDGAANDESNQYTSMQAALLLNLRLKLQIK
jgi:hypothetical protein